MNELFLLLFVLTFYFIYFFIILSFAMWELTLIIEVHLFIILHKEREMFMSIIFSQYFHKKFFFFFEREFQPIASASDDSSLSSNQDTNWFLV